MSLTLYMAAAFALLIFCHFFAAAYGLSKSRKIKGSKMPSGATVIKPVKGIDSEAYQNFKSFCEQKLDVPYQLIFSLQDEKDPVLPLLHKLKAQYPHLDIQITINPVKKGFTPKNSNLFHGLKLAKYECLILSDADMWVEPDFISRIASQLYSQEKLGVVSALPVHVRAQGFWASLYLLQLNATILAQWLPYASIFRLGVSGATIAMKKEVLEKIGGIEAFSNYVVEDVRIGLLVKEAGYQVAVGPLIYSPVGPKTREDMVSLLARGAVIYRYMLHTALELPYLVVAYFYLLLIILGIFTANPTYFLAAAVHLGGKILTGALIARAAGTSGKVAFLLPILDVIFVYVYFQTLHKGTLTWRGIIYQVDEEGRMLPVK